MVGCDFSERSVFRANKEAKKRKIDNVSFEAFDIDREFQLGTFDAVVSTQVLSILFNRRERLNQLPKLLAPNGIFISIEELTKAEEAIHYLNDVTASGLNLDSSKFIFYDDLGIKNFYTAFFFKISGTPLQINISQKYAEVLELLNKESLKDL